AVVALDPASVWGHVIDFESGGAIADAIIVAEHENQTITLTTAIINEIEPTYQLHPNDLAILNAVAGDTITLTAHYDNDIDQQTILLGHEAMQIDFVTGWKCDDFDPLPRQGGGTGLPRQGGGTGLPDVACFWGYGLVDGVPQTGMSVQLTISDTVYESETQDFPGESTPRYAIGVWGGSELDGQIITATGVLNGRVTTQQITATLGNDYHQRIDYTLSSINVLENYYSGDEVESMLWHNGYLWTGTYGGGVVRWNPTDDTYIQYTTREGLLSNIVNAIAATDDDLWVGQEKGLSHLNLATGIWTSYTPDNSMLPIHRVYSLAIAEDGTLWLGGTDTGIIHFNPAYNEWQVFTPDNSTPLTGNRGAIAIDSKNNIWFGWHSLYHLNPETGEWQNFNSDNSKLSSGQIQDIVIDDADTLWISTHLSSGIDHFNPESDTWTLVSPDNLTSNYLRVRDLDFSSDGHLWGALSSNGVAQYNPNLDTWQIFTSESSGLAPHPVESITSNGDDFWMGTDGYGINQYNNISDTWKFLTTDGESVSSHETSGAGIVDFKGNLWIGTWSRGVSRYSPQSKEWQSFSTFNSGIVHDAVHDIAINNQGELWFATDGGLSLYNQTTDQWNNLIDLPFTFAKSIEVDSNGHLWVGAAGGLIYYEPENGISSTITFEGSYPATYQIYKIVTDNNDKLWFGSSQGLIYHDPEIDLWQIYTTENSGIASNGANNIVIDKNNNLWTGSVGLSRLNLETNVWQTYTVENSDNPGKIVDVLATDLNGHIWFGRDARFEDIFRDDPLVRFNPQTNEWITYSATDLGMNYALINFLANDNEGNLWIGGEGVSKIQIPLLQSELFISLEGHQSSLPGQMVTYTINVQNLGESIAPAVVTVTLPISFSNISFNQVPVNHSPLVWDLGELEADENGTSLTIMAVIPPTALPVTIYTAVATATTTAPETYLANNSAQVTTQVLDPYHADVRVSMAGPPLLVPDNTAVYHIWIDNIGGLDAANTQLALTLPPELTLQTAVPAPTTLSPPTWELGTLPGFALPTQLQLTTIVASNVETGSTLGVTAVLTTTSPDSDENNNTA
ncbi:MAG: hypothetical protein GY943_32325, partial [Chloroflexi bacterium]|nr:hypothetical protein [Chloroflexota bacterium]